MSMYRQLWLAIVLSCLIALTGSGIASVYNAQTYLTQQLTLKNMDNASALALSISQNSPSKVSAEVALTAMFDSGHYQSIEIVAPDGKVMLSRSSSQSSSKHPYLEKLIPIRGAIGEAEISDGWKQFGRVRLQSNSSFAYEALYKTLVGLVSTMLLTGSLSCLLGYFVLRRIKAPLNEVVKQAHAISKKHFMRIKEPKLPELKKLAQAMNDMVDKLKEVFELEAQKLEAIRKEANTDPVTGVANRSFFMSSLRAVLSNEDTHKGNLILVRIANLAEANRKLGREECDKLICAIAECLEGYALSHQQGMVARLNGSDFALLTLEADIGFVLANAVLTSLRRTTSHWIKPEQLIFVGLANFSQGLDMRQLLAEADQNLAEAETAGGISLRDASSNLGEFGFPTNTQEWRKLFSDVLDQNRIKIGEFPVIDRQGQLMHLECPLRLQLLANGEWHPAGRFISMAERLDLTENLDLTAVKLALDRLNQDKKLVGIAVNISAISLLNQGFCESLLSLLKKHNKITNRLWMEVGAEQAFLHFNQFKAFCLMLKDTQVSLGIEHFGKQFAQMGMLYGLGLDYIKVDGMFTSEIDQNLGNQIFLHGLTEVAHNIGIQVIAEGLSNKTEHEVALKLGFDGFTGQSIKI